MSQPDRNQMIAILSRCSDMAIATVRTDGYPHATIVSYVNEGDRIYFGCWAQSQKAKNIALCDKVSFALHNNVRDWEKIEAVQGAGKAVKVSDAKEMERFLALMIRKFPQIEKFMQSEPKDMAVFRVDPIAVSVLDYSKGFGHTTTLEIAAPG